MKWLWEHWMTLVAIAIGVGAWIANFLGGFRKQTRALRKEYEAELSKMLDLKVRQLSELIERVTKLEAEITAVSRLYQQAIAALQRANSENDDLRRQLEDYQELKSKISQYEEKIEDQHREIDKLRARVVTLEAKDGSPA